MGDIVGALPQLAGLIEKGGVVGLLLLICGVLAYEVRRLRSQSIKTFAQRDKWRLAYVKCKAALDTAGIKVDLSDLADLTEGETS